MTKIRLYTERKHMCRLRELVSDTFDCFTVINADGCWKRKKEKSVIFEIVLEPYPIMERHINDLCKKICALNRQEFVLVTYDEVLGRFHD
jgi:hypothetical protein